MSAMFSEAKVRIFLIQHIDDPRRHEARNVGVIISDSHRVAYRLIDLNQEPQSARYRQASETLAADETYPTWFSYWQRVLERGPDGLEEVLARQRATFPVIEAGRMVGDVPDDVEKLAHRYFDELVLPVVTRPPVHETKVERALRIAGLTSSPHFRREYQMLAVGLNIPLPLTFPYAWDNGHLAVADKFLHHTGDGKIVDALLKFGHVGDGVRCIAIVDHNIDKRSPDLRDYLQRAAQVVRLDAPNASAQLRAAFGAV